MHKYPRLCLLLLSFVVAYSLYHTGSLDWLDQLNGYGYISVFIAGLLFSFGFTTPFAIAILIELSPFVHPLVACLIAGTGALLSDFFIFDLIRFSVFHDEIIRLRSSYLMRKLHSLLHHERITERMQRMLLWSFAGIIIASPLPDELGVTLVSGISQMRPRQFAAVCFSFNAIGILLILLGSRVLG